MVHAFCGTKENSRHPCHCGTGIVYNHYSTTKFRVSRSCSDRSNGTDAEPRTEKWELQNRLGGGVDCDGRPGRFWEQ